MGTLGFTGALLGADVAAKSVLGGGWWATLIPIGLAAVACLRSVFGIGFSSDTDLGPRTATFYSDFDGRPLTAARQQLLADIIGAFARNGERIRAKRRALRTSILILALGFVASTLVIAIDHPATGKVPHARQSSVH